MSKKENRSRHGVRRIGAALLSSNVVYASARFAAHRPKPTTAVTASIIRPDFKAGLWTPDRARHKRARSLKRLPFVAMKDHRGGRAANYWSDAPTGNGRDDFKRGKEYAVLTIEAMTVDGCPWYLEKIIEALVTDAISRRARGGKHSRALPPAVNGFIHELSRQLCTIRGAS